MSTTHMRIVVISLAPKQPRQFWGKLPHSSSNTNLTKGNLAQGKCCNSKFQDYLFWNQESEIANWSKKSLLVSHNMVFRILGR